jgi:putative zinc finger protein
MKCSGFERLVALYVEEDLQGVERASVEVHLQTCSACWDLAEDLKESQAALKSIRQDVPAAAALSSLRERVMGEVGGLQPTSWFERVFVGAFRRRAALAGVLLLAVGYGAWRFVPVPEVAPAPPVQITVSSPPPVVIAPPAVSLTKTPPPKRARHRAPAPVPTPTPTPQPQVTIKLLTDDPNIIIYWLVDEKGD